MSPYQHIFSTNAVLGVWRNLRNHRDQNDLLLTFQYQPDDIRTAPGKQHDKAQASEISHEISDGKTLNTNGKSIGFVVPWRSMQAQRKELREKEKELAEALVVLTGEVAFTGTSPVPHIYHMYTRKSTLSNTPRSRSLTYTPILPHTKPPDPNPPSGRRPKPPNV
jgi:hypothetical protein